MKESGVIFYYNGPIETADSDECLSLLWDATILMRAYNREQQHCGDALTASILEISLSLPLDGHAAAFVYQTSASHL